MAGKKLPPEVIDWIIKTGHKQHTVKELTELTGNIIKECSMSILLKRLGIKAITKRQRYEEKIIKMHKNGCLWSANHVSRVYGITPQFASKIINDLRLTVKSSRSRNVTKNRWHKKALRKPYKKRQPKQKEFELKKQQVQAMLNKKRATW
jgi:hypothetical protein